jgi:hypothetical protein
MFLLADKVINKNIRIFIFFGYSTFVEASTIITLAIKSTVIIFHLGRLTRHFMKSMISNIDCKLAVVSDCLTSL